MEGLMDGRLKWCYSQHCFFLSWCCRETTPQDTGMNTKWTSDTRNDVFENTNSHGSTWMDNWVTYLPTLCRFFQETRVYHCSLLFSFRCHNSPVFHLIHDNFHTFSPHFSFHILFLAVYSVQSAGKLHLVLVSEWETEKEILRKMWDILKRRIAMSDGKFLRKCILKKNLLHQFVFQSQWRSQSC